LCFLIKYAGYTNSAVPNCQCSKAGKDEAESHSLGLQTVLTHMVSILTKSQGHPLILFDGVCNLCNASVQLIIKNDPERLFRFASLQSKAGQEVACNFKQELHDIDSIVLIHQSRIFLKSDAVLEILHLLGGFYRPLSIFKFLPLSFRNWIYDWIAGQRYTWFGKKEVCFTPTPDLTNRFLS